MATQYLWPGRRKLSGTSQVAPTKGLLAVEPGGPTIERAGQAPVTPSAVTAPVVANKVGVWAGNGHQYLAASVYANVGADFNFRAFKGVIAYLAGYGANKTFKGSTAAGDSASGAYSLQRAFEGLPSVENGNASGGSHVRAKQLGYIQKAMIGFYLTATSGTATVANGLYGDMSNVALRTDVKQKIADLVAFVKFVGADGISMDWETGNWDGTPGLTKAQHWALMEQFGFEVGEAIWTTMPACELWIYAFQCEGAWHTYLNDGGPNGRTNADFPRVGFMIGLMRAHSLYLATGRLRWLDHQWYRGGSAVAGVTLQTALKYNTQAVIASLSRTMTKATRDRILNYFDICCFHWALTDQTTFYTNTQESEPAYTNFEEIYRQYSMGGWRFEYNGPGLATDTLWIRPSNRGIYNGQNVYTFPTGRQNLMKGSLASSSGSFSGAAPTLTGSVQRVGVTGNVTVSLAAAHAYGIRCINYKVYAANGLTVLSTGSFLMTWDQNGNTVQTGFTNDRMVVSEVIAVPAGGYVQATAWSTLSLPNEGLGQQRSLTLLAA